MIFSPFTAEEIIQFFCVYVADSQIISAVQSHFSNLLHVGHGESYYCEGEDESEDGGEGGETTEVTPLSLARTATNARTGRKVKRQYKILSILGIIFFALAISISSPSVNHVNYSLYTKNNNGISAGIYTGITGDNVENFDSVTAATTRRLNVSKSETTTTETGKKKTPTRIDIRTVDGVGEIVIAVGVSNDIRTYKQFIGSLRHSGFNGTIILGRPIHEHNNNNNNNNKGKSNRSNDGQITNYLHSQKNIIIHPIEITTDDCHGQLIVEGEGDEGYNRNVCVRPYTNLKLGWAGHALAKDWLKEYCSTSSKMVTNGSSDSSRNSSSRNNHFGNNCKGLVLLSPLKNIFFQRNPFTSIHPPTASVAAATSPQSKSKMLSSSQFLYLYEDHPIKTINDNFALLQCKKFQWDVPYLKSIALGDVSSVQFYLEHIVTEAYEWMDKSECYLSNTGIAIQNFLFYNGIIRPTYVFPHRTDIVNSVGALLGMYLSKEANHEIGSVKYGRNEDISAASDGSDSALLEWDSIVAFLLEEKFIDSDGKFLNEDGSVSSIIHQLDVFGESFDNQWLMKQPFMIGSNDEINDGTQTHSKGRNYVDTPFENPLYYLSLESSLSNHHYIDTTYLRKRRVMGRVEYEEEI